jgi:hypothetical protein
MKLLIYVPILTPRIKYIFNFIFNEILKTQAGFSSNIAEFRTSDLPKISYSEQAVGDEPFFKNSEFLLGHTVSPPTIKTTIFGDMIVPFAVENSSLPFDVFAASFYFVTRFEEYLTFQPDLEGNFPAELSLQSKLKLLEFPVIDGWALMLKNILLKRYPKLYFHKKDVEYTPLICLYDSKPAGTYNLRRHINRLIEKLPAFNKNNTAVVKPGNLELFLSAQHEKFNLSPIIYTKPVLEIDTLCEQRLSFPNSYLQLLKSGIKNDFRMGYKDTAGFRAGTCSSFFWYDLQLEKTTHLQVHPVALNDTMLSIDKNFNLEEALDKWGRIIKNVRLLNGHFYSVWHKETLAETTRGKAGRIIYSQLLANFLSLPNDIRPQ